MKTQIKYTDNNGKTLIACGVEGIAAVQIAAVNGFADGAWEEITAEEAEELSKPTPEEEKQLWIAEIKSRLLEIDLESVRPLRAKAYGTATPEEDEKLAALEQEAEALRAELAGLS